MTNTDNEASEDEQVRVEAWLDEHPEFFQEYLIRKGKDRLLDSNLCDQSHAYLGFKLWRALKLGVLKGKSLE